MGAAFMEAVGGVASPRVALLANGTEATKGTEIVVAAHAALAGAAGLNFVGNVEGFAIGTGAADVIVADGFTGNVALKVMEGSSAALLGAVRGAALSSLALASSAGCCCGPRCAGCATSSTPRSRAARCCSGCGSSAVVPHGSFGARGFTARDRGRGPRRARGRRRAHARAPRRGGGAAKRRPRRPLACPNES